MRTLIVVSLLSSLLAASASASTLNENGIFSSHQPARDVWHVNWLIDTTSAPDVTTVAPLTIHPLFIQADQPVHAVAVEHSDADLTRAKIHRYASYATLPLFASELALGASIYNGDSGWERVRTGSLAAGLSGSSASTP